MHSPGWDGGLAESSSACHCAGRGTERMVRLRVGTSAPSAVANSKIAIARLPPRSLSIQPPSRGAKGITPIETNVIADPTRPWRSSGVIAAR